MPRVLCTSLVRALHTDCLAWRGMVHWKQAKLGSMAERPPLLDGMVPRDDRDLGTKLGNRIGMRQVVVAIRQMHISPLLVMFDLDNPGPDVRLTRADRCAVPLNLSGLWAASTPKQLDPWTPGHLLSLAT